MGLKSPKCHLTTLRELKVKHCHPGSQHYLYYTSWPSEPSYKQWFKKNPNVICQNPATFRGRIIQDLPALKQLDGIDVSKMEKIEAGFQVSSSEEEGSEESDEEFDINDEPYRQRIAQSEGEDILREVKRSSSTVKSVIEPPS